MGAQFEERNMKAKSVAVVALCTAVLAGCAHPPLHSGEYRRWETLGEQSVRFGVVESVRPVSIHAHETGVGTATGAVLGGIAGSHVGRGSGAVAATFAGAILGGIIGQDVERSANERAGVELTVLLDSGRYIAVVQEADESFRSGDRVRVLSGRGATRVTR
jgi:outer membrane lipoprotein SlyB